MEAGPPWSATSTLNPAYLPPSQELRKRQVCQSLSSLRTIRLLLNSAHTRLESVFLVNDSITIITWCLAAIPALYRTFLR